MGSNISKELKLAKSLQETCDDSGKEIDPIKSAEVLHQFGMHYKEKSPDKISLIQSATFLNAAIVRKPGQYEFQNSLRDLCSHVLEIANATNLKADLIEISGKVAVKIKEMRNHVNQSLRSVKIIPPGLPKEKLKMQEENQIKLIRKLQNEISEQYTEIMNYVANETENIMGQPPCRYCVTGMGSLARKEITPYSDFEHVLVLEEGVQNMTTGSMEKEGKYKSYEEILKYFRWFSVIFHIIIINLKETIVRSVAVRWLNDDSITGGDWFFDNFTKCGIKFDGMQLPACKFPLGRPWKTDNKPFTVELIKPIGEMVKYLNLEEDIKNGYHLADVLTRTCFVSGSKDIHDEFQEQVKEVLSKENQIQIAATLKHEIEHKWKSFDAFVVASNLNKSVNCNIKSALYRGITLLISALGRFYKLDEFCCFDVVDTLHAKGLLNTEATHKIQNALSLSCLIRLKIYMQKEGQDDFVDGEYYNYDDFKAIKSLSSVIGEDSLIDYFTVTLSLWIEMKATTTFNLKNFSCKPLLRCSALYDLRMHNRLLKEWDGRSKSAGTPKEHAAIRALLVSEYITKTENYDKALKMLDSLEDAPNSDPFWKVLLIKQRSYCLQQKEAYKEGIQYAEKSRSTIKGLKLPTNELYTQLGQLYECEAACRMKLKQHKEAIRAFEEALKYFEDANNHHKRLYCHDAFARSLLSLNKINEARENFEAALELHNRENYTGAISFVEYIFKGLEICYRKLNQPDKETEYRKKRENLQQKYQ